MSKSMMRQLILSVTRDDCEWSYSKSRGAGGQRRDKTATVVTVKHPPSGAVGHGTESRSQWENRQQAWRRMAESPEFTRWLRILAGEKTLTDAEIQREVEMMMAPENIKVEVRNGDKWIEAK